MRQSDDRPDSLKFDNPLDNAASASTRFAIELVAWIAGPWAAADLAGTWLAAVPTLVILIALPGAFSTVGDKRQVVVAVPGRVRLLIELVLLAIAIASAFLVWTVIGGAIVTIVGLSMLFTGAKRIRWLASNRPPDWPLPTR